MASKFNEQLPEWDNIGSEVPEPVKQAGWKIKDKPPAAWFNWLLNRAYKCLKEIRQVIDDFFIKYNQNLYVKTSGGNINYTLTLDPLVTYMEGMTFTALFNSDCGINPTLKINNLSSLPIVTKDGSNLQRRDIKQNTPYTLLIYNNKFVLMDMPSKLMAIKKTIENDLNNLNYDTKSLANAGEVTNTPKTIFPNSSGSFLVSATTLENGIIWQNAVDVLYLMQYNRFYKSNSWVNWEIAVETDKLNLIAYKDVVELYSSYGLTLQNAGLKAHIGAGRFYTNSYGLIIKQFSDPANYLTLTPLTTNYIDITISGQTSVRTIGTAQENTIYEIVTSASGISTTKSYLKPFKLKTGTEVFTQPYSDTSDKIASTKFVKDYITSISYLGQDMIAKKTVFNANGSIVTTSSDGQKVTVIFNADGSMLTVYEGASFNVRKKTTFASNSVEEVII